jgi:hypothetical protein
MKDQPWLQVLSEVGESPETTSLRQASPLFFCLPQKESPSSVQWTSLDLSHNSSMGDASLVPLFSRMSSLKVLRMVNMSQDNLSDETLLVLSTAAQSTLAKLDVSECNQLNGTGLQSIAQRCQNLHTLYVSALHPRTGLSSACLHYLTRLNKLRVLDLSKNSKTVSALFLFTLLDRNKSIQCLNLSGVSAVNRDVVIQLKRMKGSLNGDLVVEWVGEKLSLEEMLSKTKKSNKYDAILSVDKKKRGKLKKKKEKKKKKNRKRHGKNIYDTTCD